MAYVARTRDDYGKLNRFLNVRAPFECELVADQAITNQRALVSAAGQCRGLRVATTVQLAESVLTRNPVRIVRLSFQPAFEDDPSPLVTIYNPEILIPPLADQVSRFGLPLQRNPLKAMSGKLKGGRKPFTEMIQSYGYLVEVEAAHEPGWQSPAV